MRSTPPEWISNLLPRTSVAMTLHSMCHPGRPEPQGDSHDGSPGFEDFHSAKSDEERLPDVVAVDVDKEPAGVVYASVSCCCIISVLQGRHSAHLRPRPAILGSPCSMAPGARRNVFPPRTASLHRMPLYRTTHSPCHLRSRSRC